VNGDIVIGGIELASSRWMTATPSTKARTRHAAHVIRSSHQAARWVQDNTGLEDLGSALTALEVVAGGIVRRLTAAEAADFIAQLPSELHEALLDLPAGPDPNLTLGTIHAELAARLPIEFERAPEITRGVGIAIRHLISPGEIADVLSQLPRELRQLLPDEVAHATP
jgi:uncharacterized protein (DUF2267 family)